MNLTTRVIFHTGHLNIGRYVYCNCQMNTAIKVACLDFV